VRFFLKSFIFWDEMLKVILISNKTVLVSECHVELDSKTIEVSDGLLATFQESA
jgi:hypothetical protein